MNWQWDFAYCIAHAYRFTKFKNDRRAANEWTWNVIYQPLGFFIFFVCAFAECNRAPFDLPEAENELNMGYHQEYSSMKLGFYLFAEYINMFISSAIIATLFFGGYDIPFFNESTLVNKCCTFLEFSIVAKLHFSFLYLCGYVGHSAFPLRSINESGLERINTIGIG